MGWMGKSFAPATAVALLLSFTAGVTPGLAGSQTLSVAARTDAELTAMLADPAQAAAFLAQPNCLERLAALQPSTHSDAFEAALAGLKELLSVDEIRPRVQLALGILNHHLGFQGAADGYLLAALADGGLPADLRERANALLGPGRRMAPSGGRLSGSLTAGLNYGAPGRAGMLAQAPEELAQDIAVRDMLVQFDAAHHFDTGFGGIAWQSGLHAETTRAFNADSIDNGLVAISSGPRVAFDRLGFTGSLRLMGGVDFATANDRLDLIAPGASLLIDWPVGGGSFAAALDWRERRYRDSAASPDNSLRDGRELAGRLGYDFHLSDWIAGSATARFADYDARRPSDSYSEWEVGLSLNSTVLPMLVEQVAVRASSQWHLGLFGDASSPQTPALGWLQRLTQAPSGNGLPLSEAVSFQIEGGFSRRETPLAEPDSSYWYGRTGLAWQF